MRKLRDPWQRLGELEGPTVYLGLATSTLAAFLLVGLGLSLLSAVILLLAGWYGFLGWTFATAQDVVGEASETSEDAGSSPSPSPSPSSKSARRPRRAAAAVSPYRESARTSEAEDEQLQARVLDRFERWASPMPLVPDRLRAAVRRIGRRRQALGQLTTTIRDWRSMGTRQVIQTSPWRNFDLQPLLEEGRRICEVSRARALVQGDFSEESPQEWRPKDWPTIRLAQTEQITAQTFLQIEVSAVEVTYVIGAETLQASFLGPQLLPLSPCDEQAFWNRARRLKAWGRCLALLPPALLAVYGLRGSFFWREETALLVAASALFSLLSFAMLWRLTLRWPVRWHLAPMLALALVGGALMMRLEPSVQEVRALLAQGELDEAERHLDALGYGDNNQARQSFWLDRLALSALRSTECSEAVRWLELAQGRADSDRIRESLMLELAREHVARMGCAT
jgi:hypothetical protein